MSQAFDPSDLLWFAMIPLWIAMTVVSTFWCLKFAVSGAWRQVVIATILPLTAVVVATTPIALYYVLEYPGDMIHFVAQEPIYDREVEGLPLGAPKFKVFDWGGWLFAWTELIYDETDQIETPQDRHQSVFIKHGYELAPLCNVDHLWGHYYVGHFGC